MARSANLTIPLRPAGERCHGRCWLLLGDCCGLACTVITYALGIGSMALADVSILIPRIARNGGWLGGPGSGLLGFISLSSVMHMIGYNLAIILMIVSHLRCMVTNPGTAFNHLDADFVQMMRREFQFQKAVPAGAYPQTRSNYDVMVLRTGRKWWCQKCDTFRPKHTHHCSTCRSCVLEMDHHCPWVNNCVGWRNHKYFVLFVGYAWLGCFWTVWVMIRALFFPPDRRLRRRRSFTSPLPGWPIPDEDALYDNVLFQFLCVFDAVVCFLFAIFAGVMACDQWEYMAEGLGAIDKKQRALKEAAVETTPTPSEKTSSAQHETQEVQPAKVSQSRCPSCCQGCCANCGCDNMPHIMGEPLSFRWLLPIPPLSHEVPMAVPEEDVIASARARPLSQRHDGEAAVDEDARISQGRPAVAQVPPPQSEPSWIPDREGPRQRLVARQARMPMSADARHGTPHAESYRQRLHPTPPQEWHDRRHAAAYEDSGTSYTDSSGMDSE